MKKILILVLIILILGVGSVFAMTAETPIPQPTVSVIEVSGQAEIKKSGSQEWIRLKTGDELSAGDEIKTGDDGQISINFYDNSTSRISSNTQISCEELFINNENYAQTNVGLMVTIGRVWSRIIQLSDQEASFEVRSNKTVATVRGTAFDFEVTAEGIANIDAVEDIVEVSTIEIKEEIDKDTGEKKKIRRVIAKVNLLEGSATAIDQRIEPEKLKIIETRIIPEVRKESQWYMDNVEEDKRFKEEIERKQAEIVEQMAGTLPDSGLYGIKKVAENIRLAVVNDPEKKEELEVRFASRRLAEAQELAEMGKMELAEEMTRKFQEKAEEVFKQEEELKKAGVDVEKIEQMKIEINNQINLQENLMKETMPDEAIYDLKRDLEDLRIDIAPKEEESFLRFKHTQERLKEADLVKEQGNEQVYNELIEEYKEQTEELRQIAPQTEFIQRINLEEQVIKSREIERAIQQEVKQDTGEDIRMQEKTIQDAEPVEQFKIYESDKSVDTIIEGFKEIINYQEEISTDSGIIKQEESIWQGIPEYKDEPVIKSVPIEPEIKTDESIIKEPSTSIEIDPKINSVPVYRQIYTPETKVDESITREYPIEPETKVDSASIYEKIYTPETKVDESSTDDIKRRLTY